MLYTKSDYICHVFCHSVYNIYVIMGVHIRMYHMLCIISEYIQYVYHVLYIRIILFYV